MKTSPQSPYAAASSTPLRRLPGDEVRAILWRLGDRPELLQLQQDVRRIARGGVARLVAAGARNDPEWNAAKARLLDLYDEAGIAAALLEPQYGGRVPGPHNLAAALVALELAWVDGGAATGALASHLALSTIARGGTEAQRQRYLPQLLPGPGQRHAALALTEPLPYAGVDKGVLSGKVRVADWRPGEEPQLQVDKRGRFITNMDFADVVVVAVESADERLRGSCLVVLEHGDPGTFDRGTTTRKLVHQLSSTRDPVFSLRVPCSRIVGGYTVEDGVIVPNLGHGQLLEAVFRRARVPVGVMTAAKLLSALEPVIRYQRQRYRGDGAEPGAPRHDLGLQLKEDTLQRLCDIAAAGEASAALGFAAARAFDRFDLLEQEQQRRLGAAGARSVRDEARARRQLTAPALELLRLQARPDPGGGRLRQLQQDPLLQYALLDAEVSVLGPATKLWNTGVGADLMREAVSLIGGSGLCENSPGFLGNKWIDCQLEATYEGPEAVQRRQLASAMTDELFLALLRQWSAELKQIAGDDPQSGACTLGTACELWLWSLQHLLDGKDADGRPLYQSQRHGVTFLMADALCWLLAARAQVLDLKQLERAPVPPALADELPGQLQFLRDLARISAARAAGEVARICTELVFGYQRHPQWRDCKACFHAEHVAHLEQTMPGIEGFALAVGEVVQKDGSHAAKAGPCVRFTGLEQFEQMRRQLDGCLTEVHLAKDRAARALATVAIADAPDYPR